MIHVGVIDRFEAFNFYYTGRESVYISLYLVVKRFGHIACDTNSNFSHHVLPVKNSEYLTVLDNQQTLHIMQH